MLDGRNGGHDGIAAKLWTRRTRTDPLFAGAGAVAAGLTLAATEGLHSWHPWGGLVAGGLGLVALYLLGMGSLMVFESRIGKLRTREKLLDRIGWRGDEAVLDVGCGRGLMLVGAARRLTSGHATGIDIWQAADQSSNTAAGTLENAAREGVADRVTVETADMRALPFVDACFDVIVSHWAVHNVSDIIGRDTALAEMVRVLRPGGTLLLADVAGRDAYAARLNALGLPVPELIVDRARDVVLKAISVGSFQPFALLARKQ